jgi:hypothetical protein
MKHATENYLQVPDAYNFLSEKDYLHDINIQLPKFLTERAAGLQ